MTSKRKGVQRRVDEEALGVHQLVRFSLSLLYENPHDAAHAMPQALSAKRKFEKDDAKKKRVSKKRKKVGKEDPSDDSSIDNGDGAQPKPKKRSRKEKK